MKSKKQIAIVTGASSGIGNAISRMLCEEGIVVYGFGRDFDSDFLEQNPEFHPIVMDLLDTSKLVEEIKKIRQENPVSYLINNAGVGYYGLHEHLNTKQIQTLVRTNLELPMLLTNLLLRDLKEQQGFVIQISSITAEKDNPHGCAYGATKAGLSNFSDSLFEEVRKYGVKVVTVQPDMTQTRLYRNADFCEGEETESYLLPEDVAEAVRMIITNRDGVVVTKINLRPQIHRIRRKLHF